MAETAEATTPQAGNGAEKAVPKKEKVTMEDGRIVEFNVNKNGKVQVFQKDFLVGQTPWDDMDAEARKAAHIKDAKIRFDFSNGSTRNYPLNPELALQYAGHGALQKYGDQLAGEDAEDLDDWAASLDKLHEQLMAGEWTKTRVGGSMAGASVLIQALMEYTGRTAQEVKAHIKDWTKDQRDQLKVDPEIKPIVDRIEAEKAAKRTKVDTGALKASLKALAA